MTTAVQMKLASTDFNELPRRWEVPCGVPPAYLFIDDSRYDSADEECRDSQQKESPSLHEWMLVGSLNRTISVELLGLRSPLRQPSTPRAVQRLLRACCLTMPSLLLFINEMADEICKGFFNDIWVEALLLRPKTALLEHGVQRHVPIDSFRLKFD